MDEQQGALQQPDVVVDIPGIGRKAFPATMKPAEIEANIRVLQQQRAHADMFRDSSMFGDTSGSRIKRAVMNPEVVAGAASMLPGVGTGTAAAIGGGASIVRDVATGQTDPIGMTARAGGHALVNAIPGAVESVVARRAVPKAGELAMTALEGKGGIIRRLGQALFGVREAAAPGVVRAGASAAGDLAGMELAGGIPVVSSQGLRKLVETSVALENSGASKMQVQALDELIKRVEAALKSSNANPAEVLSRAGMRTTSAAERAGMSEAAKAAEAAARGQTLAQRLRLALGLGSEASEFAGITK